MSTKHIKKIDAICNANTFGNEHKPSQILTRLVRTILRIWQNAWVLILSKKHTQQTRRHGAAHDAWMFIGAQIRQIRRQV